MNKSLPRQCVETFVTWSIVSHFVLTAAVQLGLMILN